MNRKLKKAAATAAIVGTSFGIGGMVAAPQFATAADQPAAAASTDAKSPGQWIKDALAGLVSDGTINQDQSNKVATALESAQPKGGPGGHHGGARVAFTAAAKALGMSEDDLKTALQADNATLASVAKSKNVDVQKVIDAIVAAENAQIDSDVTNNKLTSDQATQRKADTVKRVTEMVNSTRPARGGGGPGGQGGPGGGQPPADAPDASGPTGDSTTTTSASA